jgi:putative oxidoreductase
MTTATATLARPTFRKLVAQLTQTEDAVAPTILRLALGLVMFPHGAQKALGWFGGYGFDGTMGFFTHTVGLPWIVGALVIAIELFGSVALIVGAGARLAALGVAAVMTGAVITSHLSNGFFMNWYGAQDGEGFEYHILAIGLALAIVVAGAGKASVDRWLSRR